MPNMGAEKTFDYLFSNNKFCIFAGQKLKNYGKHRNFQERKDWRADDMQPVDLHALKYNED